MEEGEREKEGKSGLDAGRKGEGNVGGQKDEGRQREGEGREAGPEERLRGGEKIGGEHRG